VPAQTDEICSKIGAPLDRVAIRFIAAGVLISIGAILISTRGNELGLIGTVVAVVVGVALVISGIRRQLAHRPERPD
jgi:hypothetical protein